jgi:threonine/homoserine efflux transporter RhtA
VRRLLRAYRTSPIGGGVALVLVAAILVLAFGSRQSETAAWVVIAVIVAIVCLRAAPWFRRGG